jgi:hypothetical protein
MHTSDHEEMRSGLLRRDDVAIGQAVHAAAPDEWRQLAA